MTDDEFKRLVQRLEVESAERPGAYRAKVAALAVLGFVILALFVAVMGLGLFIIGALVVFLAVKGGSALIVLLKFGKAIFLLAILGKISDTLMAAIEKRSLAWRDSYA